ncbi:hypothetical protein [Nonomuraea recticatena]|uniref:Uncharacterized protein n=1 Tax=Nonomuraea recticatena TaxID=46178 RepID=A0ABN3SUL6_9ACTN
MAEQDPFSGVVTAATVYTAVVNVGERVGQVDHKVDLVAHQVVAVDQKVDGVVASVADLQTRVRELEAVDQKHEAAIEVAVADTVDLQVRVRALEANRWPKGLPTLLAFVSLLIAFVALWQGWS